VLNLKNVRIDNCGTGISAPKGAAINADGLEITNTKMAIELRDPPSFMQKLGLPHDTPPQYLIEALRILENNSHLPQEQRVQKLRESKLLKWLGAAADITGLGSVLLSAQAQGLVSSVVEKAFG
jgi:hypothetical protein